MVSTGRVFLSILESLVWGLYEYEFFFSSFEAIQTPDIHDSKIESIP